MISLKELEYVNTWTSKIPYPGIEYSEEAMNDLVTAYRIYGELYKGREYNITFSNGEEILFQIQPKNLCHMLGINTKELSSEYRSQFRSDVLGLDPNTNYPSYELLKNIVENSTKVLEYDYSTSVLNSYRIRVKCRIFDKISNFTRFDFGCINFDRTSFETNVGKEMPSNSTKYIFVQSNEGNCPYFMMGIKQEDLRQDYIVETLVAPIEPKNYFVDQEIVIPTQILATDAEILTKSNATPIEKVALLNMYKAIVDRYSIPYKMNINGDYEAMLTDQISREGKVLKKTL